MSYPRLTYCYGLLLSLVFPTLSLAAANVQYRVESYIDKYGLITQEQDPQVALAYEVFEKIRAVADKNKHRLPKLVVINNQEHPWAIALPDGHIVLSKQAIVLSYENAGIAEASARLAFIIGHELAHLANEDFTHRKFYRSLSSSEDTDITVIKSIEAAADDRGFIYAALAGYEIHLLLNNESDAHFFESWIQQTTSGLSSASSYLSAQQRAAVVRQRLRKLQKQILFFEFGVRLAHFGYCSDALYFFQEFQQTYAGREVLNNLAYCHLQLARESMDAQRAYFYWLPFVLDGVTRARVVYGRTIPVKTLKHMAMLENRDGERDQLQQAIDYLKLAVDSDESYIPSQINLAIAYLYQGKPHHTRAILEKAKLLAPASENLNILNIIALYEQSEADIDLWPNAVAKLEELAEESMADPKILFNLARLLEVRPRRAQALVYWNRLAKLELPLPAAITMIVCDYQNVIDREHCKFKTTKTKQVNSWSWPLSSQQLVTYKDIGSAQLATWKTQDFDWFVEKLFGTIYQRADDKALILEMDGDVLMQVIINDNVVSTYQLKDYCAHDLRQRNLYYHSVWSCDDWAAVVKNDRVVETWWIAN